MRRKAILLFAALLCLAITVAGQTDKVDEYVKSEMQKQHIPGASIAVVKDGKLIKAEGYGLANVELNVAAKPDTVYKIGSVSKQFIATGIMLLLDEGKLSLEDKINKFLDNPPDSWKDITIRHLLTHTSGIVREAPGFNPFKVQSDAEVIKTAYSLPLRFAPGEKWEYCNVGYFTLAEIIFKVSGKPWSDFISERVFRPSEMNATGATDPVSIVPNRADSYNWVNDKWQNAAELLAMRPSGAFISTVLDLARWDAALYSDKILKPSIREQMWTPVKLNNGTTHPYGFGWELGNINGRKVIRHGGTLAGFRAQFVRFVDDRLTIIVLTNCGTAKPNEIALGVANFYLNGLISSHQELIPFLGTWKANIEKSKRHPNHMFKSLTMKFELSGDEIVVTFNGIAMSGQEQSGTTKLHPDGKEHPIDGAPGVMALTKKISANVMDSVAKKDGKVVGQSNYEVSGDGKILTIKIKGIDGTGQEFDQIIVFDRA